MLLKITYVASHIVWHELYSCHKHIGTFIMIWFLRNFNKVDARVKNVVEQCES
jgi:hypothetical protein